MTAAQLGALEAAGDRWSLRIIFGVTFAAVLGVALVSQVFTLRWRAWFPGAEGTKSLFGGVSAAVNSLMSLLI